MARYADDTPTDHDPEKPNHMIFWLDATIGDPSEYKHLKKAFGSNTDPRHETWTMLTDRDYDIMLAAEHATTVNFEGVVFLLQAFDNENDCLRAFEQNQDKHIFFITSGSMGRNAVPRIIERYRNVFTDQITNKPYRSVYVFCHDIALHMDWGLDYLEYIQMFNFDSELLERMTRDIAEYFIERCERFRQTDELKEALQRLHWAKRLWHQYDKMQQQIDTDNPRPVRESQRMKEINAMIEEIENDLVTSSSSDNENSRSDDDERGHEPF